MTTDEQAIDWSSLPTDDDGIPYIEFGGGTYRLPYTDLIPQNVALDSLRASIAEEGMEYPIIVDQDDNVIDGMTRLYLASRMELPADEVPIKHEQVDADSAWEKAIELNTVRRQIGGAMRRELIETIIDRKNWRKPRIHVTDLANMLGVDKSTISRDLDQIFDDQELNALKKRKRKLNVSLTGMRNVRRLIEAGDIMADRADDEKAEFCDTLQTLVEGVEGERSKINDRIDELEES